MTAIQNFPLVYLCLKHRKDECLTKLRTDNSWLGSMTSSEATLLSCSVYVQLAYGLYHCNPSKKAIPQK